MKAADIQTLTTAFGDFQAQLNTKLEQQQTEIRTNGETSRATATQIETITNGLADVGREIEAFRTRVTEMENAGGRPANAPEREKTAGQRFVESEIFNQTSNGSRTRGDELQVKTFWNMDSGSSSGGAAIERQRLAGIISAPERTLRLRDLLDVQPTATNAIDFVQETGFTNNAANRVEGAAAAQSDLTYALKTANVKNIGHWIPATRQMLGDAPQLAGAIDKRLTYGVKLKEEGQIIYGSGVDPQLMGLRTHANVQAYAWSDGVTGDTEYDAIRRAITLSVIAGYPVNGVVLHPTNWERIETLKGSDGHYLLIALNGANGEKLVWRVPVVETTAINVDESLVGAFGMAATLFDREQASIRVTDAHSDYFIKGQVAILAEERVALANLRPESFVALDFDAAPA
jgi:HK97 family phage major capsid protein